MPTTTTTSTRRPPKVQTASTNGKVEFAVKVTGDAESGYQFQCTTPGCKTKGWAMEERDEAVRLGAQHLARKHGVKKGAVK